jgi:hypothetical protein
VPRQHRATSIASPALFGDDRSVKFIIGSAKETTSTGGAGMTRMLAIVPLVWLFLASARSAEPKPAAELLSAGLAQAKDQDKKVFLLFGSPG